MYFTLPHRTYISNKLSSKEMGYTTKNKGKFVKKCLTGVCILNFV